MGNPSDPKSVFEAYVRSANAGDLEAVMALFDETVTTSDEVRQVFEGTTGKDSLRKYIGDTVIAMSGALEIVRIAVSDDGWAYGDLVLRSDMVRQYGQTRILGIDRIHVVAGKITEFSFLPNVLDTETRNYYANMGALGATPQ